MRELWIFRHGDKLSYDTNEWKKHRRYKENPFDPPLTTPGLKLAKASGVELIKKSAALRGKKIKYIYCSPMTRCVQTALQIIKVVREKIGYEIEIIIVDDLAESMLPRNQIKFQVNKIKFIIPKYYEQDGKKWTTMIDKKIQSAELKKKYGEIKKVIVSKKPFRIENPNDESIRMFKAILKISKIKQDSIIIGHSNTLDISYNYFNQKNNKHKNYDFNGRKMVNTMIGFKYDESKKSYQMIYQPNNKF
jgi:broad specificity phosphatase PhoE